MITTSPLYILAMLLGLIVFSEWLGTKKYFKYLGSVLIVIIAAAILANLGIIPSSAEEAPIYDGIFTYAAPLGIFYLMLGIRLKDLKHAGLPMILMFLLGSVTTIIGTLAGYFLLSPGNHGVNQVHAVAGMFTGTYIGGSANLNAVALHYGINKDGLAIATINAADNIATTLWTIVMIIIPPVFQKFFPRKNIAAMHAVEEHQVMDHEKESISVTSVALLLALGTATLFVSNYLSAATNKVVPSILILTTIALSLAQFRFIQRISGAKVIGYFLILLFLAVVGAFCDLGALNKSGSIAMTLFGWITMLILVHGILLFVIGSIFKQDWYILSIASIANIGGPTSAAAVATSMGRSDLRLPAILVGSIGAAMGTYLGILIAEYLK